MTAHDERDVETVAEALIAEGAAPGASLHSWRCEHPDQYGECDCVAETARAVLDALDLPGRERRAKAEALREFAGVLSTLARIGDNGSDLPSVKLLRAVRNDMRNRAAEIDPEEGDHE